MSEIALYNALTKLGLEPNEAKEAVTDITSAREVATKIDIKDMATKTDLAEIKTEIANLETRLTKLIYAVVVINTGVIIAAVGLMIKFLN